MFLHEDSQAYKDAFEERFGADDDEVKKPVIKLKLASTLSKEEIHEIQLSNIKQHEAIKLTDSYRAMKIAQQYAEIGY